MKKRISQFAVVALLATNVQAIPSLQLGVSNGVYDPIEEDVVSTGDVFTLYALLNPNGGNAPSLASDFRISAAIIKVDPSAPAGFGSFTINGGVPSLLTGTPIGGDLPSHGIFNALTKYAEVPFAFGQNDKAKAYNVADDPNGFMASPSGLFYYHAFDIDASGLAAGYELHFDLYTVVTKSKTKNGVTTTTQSLGVKAPFSHDARSGDGHDVPDGGATVALLGTGILGIGALRRCVAR